MSNKVFYAVALVLVLSAAGLGYMLVGKGGDSSAPTQGTGAPIEGSFNPNQGGELPGTPAAPTAGAPVATTSVPNSADYKDPKVVEVLTPLPANATAEQQQARFKLVESLAKTVMDVHVGGDCRMGPPVIKVNQGVTVPFINGDTQAHTIVIDADHHWTIAPGEKAQVKIDFGKGAGIYGFSCDNHSNGLGIFFVMPNEQGK